MVYVVLPGANHAPQEYIDKYKGKFDDGYEAYREWVLERMIERGVVPADTELTPLNPMPDDVANAADHVRPWTELNDDGRSSSPGWPRCSPASPSTPTHRSAGSSNSWNAPVSWTTP